MSKPTLFIVAGCNGSGKSPFSKALSPKNSSPYDYDLVFLEEFPAYLNKLIPNIADRIQ